MTIHDKQAELGERLAKELNLRPAKGYTPKRWHLGPNWGTRTAVGVYLTVQRLAAETSETLGRQAETNEAFREDIRKTEIKIQTPRKGWTCELECTEHARTTRKACQYCQANEKVEAPNE